MKGVLVGASLRGKSEVFGDVYAVQSPQKLSVSEYDHSLESGRPAPYKGSFDIYGWFYLPKFNRMFYTTEPVRVTGYASAIPPVGQTASASDKEVPLRDFGPDGQDVGTVTNAKAQIHSVVPIDVFLK